jgi:hypothetical protein
MILFLIDIFNSPFPIAFHDSPCPKEVYWILRLIPKFKDPKKYLLMTQAEMRDEEPKFDL